MERWPGLGGTLVRCVSVRWRWCCDLQLCHQRHQPRRRQTRRAHHHQNHPNPPSRRRHPLRDHPRRQTHHRNQTATHRACNQAGPMCTQVVSARCWQGLQLAGSSRCSQSSCLAFPAAANGGYSGPHRWTRRSPFQPRLYRGDCGELGGGVGRPPRSPRGSLESSTRSRTVPST